MRTYAELPGLMTLMTGDEKHGPSATSTLDVLWVLYDQVLRVSPATVDDPGRDRFLLSKGHGPAAYYAVLAAKGFFPEAWLADFGSASSPLGYHPDRSLVPGVEIASGSLGHGLPIGVGLAHGLLARGLPGLGDPAPRVYVLVGDAELDEGSNSEAIVYAGAVGLPNLTVVAVDNQSSSYGWGPGGIEAHFAVSGWSATRVSGRDHSALASAFRVTGAALAGPQLVVAAVEGQEALGKTGRTRRPSQACASGPGASSRTGQRARAFEPVRAAGARRWCEPQRYLDDASIQAARCRSRGQQPQRVRCGTRPLIKKQGVNGDV